MPADLRLTGAIPKLLRRGSPVWWRDEETPYVVTCDYFDADYAPWTIAAPCVGLPIGVQDDPSNFTLDLTDPTARYHALLWLRERGYNLRWAEDEADVLAWSVLSVSRGGGVLRGVDETAWRPTRDGDHARGGSGKSPLRIVGARGWLFFGSMNPLERHTLSGPETGAPGRDAADRAALAHGYALRNADGSLTLPELSAPPVKP